MNHFTPSVSIRPIAEADYPSLLAMFRETIRKVNIRDYSTEQINAWSSDDLDADEWFRRFDGRTGFIAELEGEQAGFGDLAADGYIDRFFVSHRHQRMGVGKQLMHAIFQKAQAKRLQSLNTDASITARPFFESQGFSVVREQSVPCRGQMLTNFRMSCQLAELP